ncbi:MAG: hypothetical protein HOV86_13325 [Thermoactinospora sp.]|nr:hypothetical protein [Thermoactinospora sp.]
MMRGYWSQVTDPGNIVATALNTWKKYVVSDSLHDAGLVNVYRLIQVPVVVGEGKRLFAEGTVPATYRITDSQVLAGGSGAISLTLRQTGFGSTGVGEFVVEDGQEGVR